MKKSLASILDAARRLFSQPMSELNRWQLTARYAVGIARYGAHELREDRAAQMAAALTYRTIFSLVPLFVLSLLVFNAFGGFADVGGDLQEKIYGYLGLDAISLQEDQGPPPVVLPSDESAEAATPPPVAADAPPESGGADTKARVDELLSDLQAQVESVNLTSIGLVGLALLIWAGLSLVVSLETNFNRVYHAPQGRPWHLRITIYWATITLGPVLVALSFYITSKLIDAAASFDAFGLVGWGLSVFTPFASLATTWLLLILLYKLLPNVRVNFRAAVSGALAAAVLWEASKWAFRLYVDHAVGYSALYGSLGLVPLFLLWMYLTWLVVLFGLEISYVLQTVRGSRFLRSGRYADGLRDTLIESHCVLGVAAALARAFEQGEARTVGDLAGAVRLSPAVVESLTRQLVQAQVVHAEEGDEESTGALRLSRPADTVRVAELLEIGRRAAAAPAAEGDAMDASFFQRLRAAELLSLIHI